MDKGVDEPQWRATEMKRKRILAYKAAGGLFEHWICGILTPTCWLYDRYGSPGRRFVWKKPKFELFALGQYT
jgi:hypothetical protein